LTVYKRQDSIIKTFNQLSEKGKVMKTMRNAIVVIVLASLLSSGCETLQSLNVKKPTASLKDVKFGDVSLDTATLVFDTEVNNPYTVALPLTNIDYAVATNAKPFTSGTADIATTIPAQSSKVVSIPVKIDYVNLINAFKGIKPGSQVPYKAELGLLVDAPVVGSLRLPFNKTGELAVPSIPKVNDVEKMILDRL
jgi:LEA14-like dessication related protein